MNAPSLIPVENGELHEWQITHVDGITTVRCKTISNAMRSFEKAVPRHGRIISVRKVGK